MDKQHRIVFVCLGNICRSPSAEAVFTKLVNDRGLDERFVIDSAATGSWHVGEPADARMQKHAAKRGYQLTSIGRQFVAADFERFDFVIGMDGNNVDDIRMLDRRNEYSQKISKMTAYCS
jgi:protein-tyrosine phosphatase